MKSLQLQKPHLLVVIGLPGSGKSFFASQFSANFSAPYLDYEEYRRLIGNDLTAARLASNTLAQLIRTRQTIIIEGIGSSADDRHEIALIAKKNDYGVLYIWVQTEPQTALRRAMNAKDFPISQHEFTERAGHFEILQKADAFIVISGRHTYATQARAVLKKLIIDRPKTEPSLRHPVPPRGRIMG